MMSIILRIILPIILIVSCASAQEHHGSKKRVFLFAGQSNMDGRANGDNLSKEDLNRLSKVANRIQFYYNHKPVTPLQLTEGSSYIKKKFNLTYCFGPELFFGIKLAEKYPNDDFIFIKRSIGGTSLYGCWNPNWTEEKATLMNEQSKPKLYSDFISYTKSILKTYNPNEYVIEGMLWVQGEADSGVKRWGNKPADNYRENLKALIKSTRNDLKAENLPFIMFQVGQGKVVEGMKEVAKKDNKVYLIPQSKDKSSYNFYERNPPPIGHYIAKSMKKIGIEFYKVFENISNKN